MDKYKMTGIVESVGPVQLIGANKFRKREVVLCDNPDAEYPHRLIWELTQDKVSLINEAHTGSKVTIEGWPESRSWNDKTGKVRWFTSMRANSVVTPEVQINLTKPTNCPPPVTAQELEDVPF